MSSRLTYKQRQFIEAYLGPASGNATEAARIAGYARPNEQGPRLTVKRSIQAAIAARLDESALTTSEILARLSEQATSSVQDFLSFPEKGKGGEILVDLDKARRLGKLHLIKKLRPTAHGIAIELYDAQAALIHLGKYRRLWDESTTKGQAGQSNADTIRDFLFGNQAEEPGPTG